MQLVEVGTKLVGSANRGREVGHRTRRVERKVGQALFGVLKLGAQDKRARAALFKQLAQLRLRHAPAGENRPETRLQRSVERLVKLGGRTAMIHAGGIMAKEACQRRIVPGGSSGSPPREGWLLRGPSSRAYSDGTPMARTSYSRGLILRASRVR